MTSSAVSPALAARSHPRDLLAWHGLAALAMLLMAMGLTPGWLVRAGVALFGVGAVWCVARAVRTSSSGPFLRLGVCCVAMVVMLVPLLSLAAGDLQPVGHHAGHASVGPAPAASAAVTPAFTAAVVIALVAVLAVGVRRLALGRATWRHRVAAGLEAALAGAMVAMLLAGH